MSDAENKRYAMIQTEMMEELTRLRERYVTVLAQLDETDERTKEVRQMLVDVLDAFDRQNSA